MFDLGRMVAEAGVCLVHGGLKYHFPRETVRIAVDRCSPKSQADTGSRQSPTARGYVSCGDKLISGNAMERGA